MSILIKGIDIPKCCDECTLKYSINCKTYIGYHHRDKSRANKCPIVEVQTPHGKLIDADEYKNDILTSIEPKLNNTLKLNNILKYLADAPAIIKAESEE